jgi:iron complex transport system permease protein
MALSFLAFLLVLACLFGGLPSGPERGALILWVRIPETLTALSVGMALGLSGLLLQTVLRNPLADPFVVGIAGGAALGAVTVSLLAGSGLALGWLLGLRAGSAFFVGYLALAALIAGARGRISVLLLGGVVVNTVCGSAARLLALWISPGQLASVTSFLVGFIPAPPLWAPLLLGTLVLWGILRFGTAGGSLDLMLLSEGEALSLGLNVRRFRAEVLVTATFLAAASVALTGVIGFVGLVSPHAARLLGVRRHRSLVVASALAGGIFLLGAHLVCKLASGHLAMPVGVATTLVGAPAFLTLLLRRGEVEP